MKLIIEIPEEAYKQIMEFGFLENTHGKICYKAIKNGAVLPKGHGRLIDADEFIKAEEEWLCKDCKRRQGMKNGKWKFIYEIGDAPCRACFNMDMFEYIDEAPTVLEADNETNTQ